jgi:hypothetical protein
MSEKEKNLNNGMNRRDFLKKSAYTAYATPIVYSLLVEKASAAQSWNSGRGECNHTASHDPVGPNPPSWTKDNNPQ